MSEERFDRLENQLSQVIQGMTAMQSRIDRIEVNLNNRIDSVAGTLTLAMQEGFGAVNNRIDALSDRVDGLSDRVESLEVTTRISVREAIRNQRSLINDLGYDLSNQERVNRRLRGRVERWEDIIDPHRTTDT